MKLPSLLSLLTILLLPPLAGAVQTGFEADFQNPPVDSWPSVYWYFMEGNMTREGITADLESMKKAGIGGALYLEVDIGVPRGPIKFMSPEWQELVRFAFTEAERLGIDMALGTGPGWCGTGGSWIKPEQSMQHIVASETAVTGPAAVDQVLPQPKPRTPFFGLDSLSPAMKEQWEKFYIDVMVIAFPTPKGDARIADIDGKALYYRAPYSSQPGVKPFLLPDTPAVPAEQCVAANQVIDLTSLMQPDGRLQWDVPEGDWTVLRLGRTLTGQNTRPAPASGLGFESDKFDKAAIESHLDTFHGTLLKGLEAVGKEGRGLTSLHFDSWEMGSQNWSEHFREEFKARRGYDLQPYLPVLTGRIVDSADISERFLWDFRQTAQELVFDNHIVPIKEFARRLGLSLSIEPYDLNPTADLALGGMADVPMCEFWADGHGFLTSYSVFEAVSVAHTMGKSVVGAESFTSDASERWLAHPGSMKDQGDWALAAGINRIVFHTYQHQPKMDEYPGMTMGIHGVHWGRTQTWWDLAAGYHTYLSRCQYLLRQGKPVSDILYLAAEGAPHVFRPPASATMDGLPDRRGYSFDGCNPDTLIQRATVQDGKIIFPDGPCYSVLVLPAVDSMTPALLRKIKELVESGATVIGTPPKHAPSLVNYPACDQEVQQIAGELWGDPPVTERTVGKGRIIVLPRAAASTPRQQGNYQEPVNAELYPDYASVANVLQSMLPHDLTADDRLRYIHRSTREAEIYFVANRGKEIFDGPCTFRVTGRQPEWWDPITGQRRDLPQYEIKDGCTTIPLKLDAFQSGFVMFNKTAPEMTIPGQNFPELQEAGAIVGAWQVHFDPKFGGPASVTFDALQDWTTREEPDIKYYSGKAVYSISFDRPETLSADATAWLSLGTVHNMASVTLNDRDLGVVWCAPWRVEVPTGLLRERGNHLEITVANLWPNRLIGDAALPPSERLTKTTFQPFKKDDPLLPSGLLGPVVLMTGKS